MPETILVPLDGSALAECALPYARQIGRASGARILLLRATQPRSLPAADSIAAERAAAGEVDSYLAAVATTLSGDGPVETAVFYGDPVEAIVTEAGLRDVLLVVMATHARTGVDRLVFGSIAEAIMQRSPAPVLLVHESTRDAETIATQPRIVVPLDGSPFAEEALGTAAAVAEQLGGELVLVQAINPPEHGTVSADGRIVATVDQVLDRLRAEARDYLEHTAARIFAGRSGPAPKIEVRLGAPTAAIVEASAENRAAMVVMATHGRTGMARLLLGSVARGVVHDGPVPVLLVRPAAIRQVAS
ncbi:MAG: universal stress protein [Chloroflexi bacterium]|nr:universal stress protein [Chloroflexota bacterium]